MTINESETVIIVDDPKKKARDFSSLLDEYSVVYTREDPYFLVGSKSEEPGWILEISVVRSQVIDLLKRLIPILYLENLPFRIANSPDNARHILDGNLGHLQVGRLISIYPGSDEKAVRLARILIRETKKFAGPAIPGSVPLGGAVYTMKNDNANVGVWPFKEFATGSVIKSKILLHGTYLRYSLISSKCKGNVVKGINIKPFWRMNWCLIKQGKRAMLSDDLGFDMKDRLKWQKEIHQALKGIIPIPAIIDLFEEGGDQFLVMEFIEGQTLDMVIPLLFNNKNWDQIENKIRIQILDYLLQVIHLIGRLHQKGLIHRDITPANFMLDKKNNLFLIDMELAYSMKNKFPSIPFELGTYGYMSPEQVAHETPTEKEDIYALGAFMVALLTCQNPINLDFSKLDKLRQQLLDSIKDHHIAECIVKCSSRDPCRRPTIEEINEIIGGYKKKYA